MPKEAKKKLDSGSDDDGNQTSVSSGETPQHAKEAITLDKAIQKKKSGHYLKCAACGTKFVKLVKAKNHREEQSHDDWFVRFSALEGTGIYEQIDENRSEVAR